MNRTICLNKKIMMPSTKCLVYTYVVLNTLCILKKHFVTDPKPIHFLIKSFKTNVLIKLKLKLFFFIYILSK